MIRDSPDVNTPFTRVTFETYTPLLVPAVIVGVDNGAGPDPLSIAKMFPTTLAGFVVARVRERTLVNLNPFNSEDMENDSIVIAVGKDARDVPVSAEGSLWENA